MSERIEQLLRNNQAFVAAQLALDPGYFERLSEGQQVEFLRIGIRVAWVDAGLPRHSRLASNASFSVRST